MASAAAKAPTSELGHVASSWYPSGWPDDREETAALAWPQSNWTYDRMRRSGTVANIITAVTRPIRRPNVFVLDPQGARPEIVTQIAEDMDLPIVGQEHRPPPLRRRGRFSWLDHVRLALSCLTYGHMGFELVCDAKVLKDTGMARLAKLAPRFPHTISHIDTAPDGGLVGIRQWSAGFGFGPEVPIPVSSLVWYANERLGAAWQGQSFLRPSYGSWLRLDRMLRARAYLMERQSMGIPVGEAPEGASQEVIDDMGSLAQQARAGDQSGVGIPHGARIRLIGVEGTLPDINGAIADEKAALADSVMASFLRLGTGKSSGNRALGQTFVDQFTQSEDSIAGQIADVATQHVVEDLVDLNWGENEPAPAVVARPIDAETDIDPADLVSLIHEGAITPDDSLQDFLRSRYHLPKRGGGVPALPAKPVAAKRRSRRTSTDDASPRSPADGSRSAADDGMRVTTLIRAAGAAAGKQWVTGSGNPCDECLANEDAGVIGDDEDWPSGDAPVHPNCECSVEDAELDEGGS
jgi:hypothetical protein